MNTEAFVSHRCLSSHFLHPSAASLIISLSPSPQHCYSHPVCFLFPFVFHHLSMMHLLWARELRAGFLLRAGSEILTRLWCLLIVPHSNWDAPRSPSPWWRWQPRPLGDSLSPTETPRRERWEAESWGKWREGGEKSERTVWFFKQSEQFQFISAFHFTQRHCRNCAQGSLFT